MSNVIIPFVYLTLLFNCCLSQVIHSSFIIEPKVTATQSKSPISFLMEFDNKYQHEESKLSVSLEHLLLIDVFIGNPPQKKRIKLATHPLELWVLSDDYAGGYSSSRSSSAMNLDFCQVIKTNGGIKGEVFTDDVILLGESLFNFPFLNVIHGNVDQTQYVGGIGFGYKYEGILFLNNNLSHSDYSVLDSLKKDNKIDKRILNVDFNKQTFSLGSLESSFNSKYLKQCNLIQLTIDNKPNPKWDCLLDSAYFESHHNEHNKNNDMYYFKINKPVTFSLGSNVILVSGDFFDYITNNYLKIEYSDDLCQTSPLGKYYIINCVGQIVHNNIPPLSFVFGKWTIKIPFKDLLLDNKVMIAKSDKKNKWIFGFPFLRNYLNVFNKESNTFGLYKQ